MFETGIVNHDDGEIDIHYLHPLPTNVGHTYHHSITLRYTHTFLFSISSFYTIHTHTHTWWVSVRYV